MESTRNGASAVTMSMADVSPSMAVHLDQRLVRRPDGPQLEVVARQRGQLPVRAAGQLAAAWAR